MGVGTGGRRRRDQVRGAARPSGTRGGRGPVQDAERATTPPVDRYLAGVTGSDRCTGGRAAARPSLPAADAAGARALAGAGATWLLLQGVKRLVDRPAVPWQTGTRQLIAEPRGTSWPSSHPAVLDVLQDRGAASCGSVIGRLELTGWTPRSARPRRPRRPLPERRRERPADRARGRPRVAAFTGPSLDSFRRARLPRVRRLAGVLDRILSGTRSRSPTRARHRAGVPRRVVAVHHARRAARRAAGPPPTRSCSGL